LEHKVYSVKLHRDYQLGEKVMHEK